jgi:hypothetical protein
MSVLLNAITLLTIGLLVVAIAALGVTWPFANMAEGELRCEGKGAVIVRVLGKDYAANGVASARYPPLQQIWNSETYANTDVDRLIARGLTLCDW